MPDTGRLIGQVFAGRYRIEELVGRGGMGHVFRAVHLTMNKVVALKVLSSVMAVDPENVARFEREAAAASELRHPNTINVFDFGTTDEGELYLGMEFLSGRTLAQCIEEDGPFSPARACHVFRQLMESLEEAHAKDIIHRDLKPENVFLTEIHRNEDFVKVLDFGIAKFKRTDQIKQTLTRSGFVCGTPQYLAPEQGLGTDVSPATDLYSAGVVLYEILTGSAPFSGDEPITLVMKHIHEAPPPLLLDVSANLPTALSVLLWQLLDKDPARRPRSATEVLERLDSLEDLSDNAPPRPEDEHTAPDAGPTQVMRHTPGRSEDALTSTPTVAATPIPDTSLDPTLRISAPPGALSPARRSWRTAMLPLLVILLAVAGFGLWRPWEEPTPIVGGPFGPKVGAEASGPTAEPVPEPEPEPESVPFPPLPTPDPDPVPTPDPFPHDPKPEPEPPVGPNAAGPNFGAETPPTEEPEPVPEPEPITDLHDAHPLRLTSSPTAAAVTVDDVRLGTTPIEILVDHSRDPVRVRITMVGYHPQVWSFIPGEVGGLVGEKEFILEPLPKKAPPGTGRPPGDGSPFGDLW